MNIYYRLILLPEKFMLNHHKDGANIEADYHFSILSYFRINRHIYEV